MLKQTKIHAISSFEMFLHECIGVVYNYATRQTYRNGVAYVSTYKID